MSGTGGGKSLSITSEDEAIYANAVFYKNSKDYNNAIYQLKDLIDNYDTSKFVNAALGEIYLDYKLKDTGTTQSFTANLF